MTIGIIGLGFVGLTFAVAAAKQGFIVYGVEKNNYIHKCLSENRAHFFEPGLDRLIEKHMNHNLFCVGKFPEDVKFDAFVITVGTPLQAGKKEPDFGYIVSALDAIKHIYTGVELIILRSTVSVGTTRSVVLPALEKMVGKDNAVVPMVSMCPERTVEGKAIEELVTLPQIISGNSNEALEKAQGIFRRITPYVVEAGSLEEAELVKLYCNVYRDMDFALANVLNSAAQTFGIDGTSVIKNANLGYNRSNIAGSGFVAGPCLEKDAYLLTSNMKDCKSRDFIRSARNFNESVEDEIVLWVEHEIGKPSPDKKILLTGMAFKGVPETSDLRGSSSVNIAKKLKKKGYVLRLHDFIAGDKDMRNLGLGEVFHNLNEACAGICAMLVLNNCRQYHSFSFSQDIYGAKILDVWDCCDELKEKGYTRTIGNMWIEEGL